MAKIDFYYWGNQCPHNSKMRKMFNILIDKYNYQINLYDISDDFNTAEKLNIFSPTMTVIDNDIRIHGPILMDKIMKIEAGEIPEPRQYKVDIGTEFVKGELKSITGTTICDTCRLCASSGDNSQCDDKGKWIEDIRKKFGLLHLGKLHYVENKCVGGAEFVPSVIVPYAVPKAEDTAFLTCSFLSAEEADYKSYPLQALEKELPQFGYKSVISVASQDSCFPNGPLKWFTDRGYTDAGELYYEKMEMVGMHLIKKTLWM